MRLVTVALLAFAAQANVNAEISNRAVHEVTLTVKAVEAAFYRRHAQLDAQLRQPAAAQATSELFPAFGFAPRTGVAQVSLHSVDADRTDVCLTMVSVEQRQWYELAAALKDAGYEPATSNCQQSASPLFAPPQQGVPTRAVKRLDRRDVPVPTVHLAEVSLTPFEARQALPLFSLPLGQSQEVVARNLTSLLSGTCETRPNAPADARALIDAHCDAIAPELRPATEVSAEQVFSILSSELGPGLTMAAPACAALARSASCTLTFAYSGTLHKVFRSARLSWSTAPRVVVGGTAYVGAATGAGFSRIGFLVKSR